MAAADAGAAPAPAIQTDEHGYAFINGRRVRVVSTANFTPPDKKSRKRKRSAAAQNGEESTPKKVKTTLRKRDLEYFRKLLLERRLEILADLTSMETEALLSRDGNLSHMPLHMADVGSDAFDQELLLSLAESKREPLREIEEALQRIQEGTYGMCQLTGEPIPRERLEYRPWAKYTTDAKRRLEGGRMS